MAFLSVAGILARRLLAVAAVIRAVQSEGLVAAEMARGRICIVCDRCMVEWQGGGCRSDAPNLFDEMPVPGSQLETAPNRLLKESTL
ncbi:hypothetical protein SEVIR_3G181850v4 [Setaria viridis]